MCMLVEVKTAQLLWLFNAVPFMSFRITVEYIALNNQEYTVNMETVCLAIRIMSKRYLGLL